MSVRIYALIALIAGSVLFAGCSPGKSVLEPGAGSLQPSIEQSMPQSDGSHQCLGLYTIAIDTANSTVAIVPVRSSALHVNVVSILNTTMGVTAVMVPGESDPPNGLFALDISLTHPFPTKPEFAGFDVKGILITPGSLGFNQPDLGNLVFADVDETALLNADGFTRWWNPTEFTSPGMFGYTPGVLATATASALTATVNPYKLFADLLGPTDLPDKVSLEPLDSDMGRAVFTAGKTNTRRYQIRFPMSPGPQIIFGYAIDASWSPPSVSPPVNIPDDFPIGANQQEACLVKATQDVNTLYYDGDVNASGGVLRLRFLVYDWQGQSAGHIHDDIDSVWVLSPDLLGTTMVKAVFGDQDSVHAEYTVDLTGKVFPTASGKAIVAVAVKTAQVLTYKQSSQPAPDLRVFAFQVFTVDISDPECTADADNDFGQAQVLALGGDEKIDQVCNPDDPADYYTFNITNGYAPAGSITLWCNSKPDFPASPALTLYDSDHQQLMTSPVTDGKATVTLTGSDNMPGDYYLKVTSTCSDQVVPYYLESLVGQKNVTPANPVEITPPELYVNAHHNYIHDNRAYLLGYGTWVYDISTPSDPVQLYANTDSASSQSCFEYPYCYFSTFGALFLDVGMADFSNPASPVIHDSVINTLDSTPAVMCMDSNYLFIGIVDTPNFVVKVYEYDTNPASPQWLCDITGSGMIRTLDFVTPESGPRTLIMGVGGASPRLIAYDIQNLPTCTYLCEMPISCSYIYSTGIWNDYIYATVELPSHEVWLYTYLIDPSMPGIYDLDDVKLPGGGHSIKCRYPYAYVGDGSAGLSVVDISIPFKPQYVGSYDVPRGAGQIDIEGNILCANPYSGGLYIFDLSIGSYPLPISHLRVINHASEGYFKDDYLIIVAAGEAEDSLKTVYLPDAGQPEVVEEHYPQFPMTSSWLDGDVLAAPTFQEAVQIFNVSDPASISLYCAFSLASLQYSGVAIHSDALYILTNGPKFYIFDIADPSSPKSTGSFGMPVIGRNCAFYGYYMYVASDSGLVIYSVADEFNPAFVSIYPTASKARDMVVRGNTMYLLREDGLEVIDLFTPGSPASLGWVDIPGGSYLSSVALDGPYAYVCGGQMCTSAVSIWPPDSPSLYGSIYDETSPYGASDVLIRDGVLYELGYTTGLRIFDLY